MPVVLWANPLDKEDLRLICPGAVLMSANQFEGKDEGIRDSRGTDPKVVILAMLRPPAL